MTTLAEGKDAIREEILKLRAMANSTRAASLGIMSKDLTLMLLQPSSAAARVHDITATSNKKSADHGTVIAPGQCPSLQLNLLPLRDPVSHSRSSSASPQPYTSFKQCSFPWHPASLRSGFCSISGSGNARVEVVEAYSSGTQGAASPSRDIDVNQVPSTRENCEEPGVVSSPSSSGLKRERESMHNVFDLEQDRPCEISSRAGSDDEEGGTTRKKLRMSKEQSAFLEESFKEHSTLNPKQKNTLAKQLNLRPRQVEVWFQNRRARTKLKQTEVDCERLKRCCDCLTLENRRLQKELHELKAIKVAAPRVMSQDFHTPLPAATLAMCPSCERISTVADNRAHGFTKPGLSHLLQSSAA